MKGTTITFRLKEEEKERLQAVAKEQDITVSELILGQTAQRHALPRLKKVMPRLKENIDKA